jgi:hypothetical protein
MNKDFMRIAKLLLLVSAIYLWPSCDKDDNDQPPPVTDTTGNNNDTAKKPDDTANLKGWVVSTLAGSNVSGYVDGNGAQARFATPNDITQDANGDLYVCEQASASIRKITEAGQVSTYIKEDSSKGAYIRYITYFLSDGYGQFYYAYNYYHVRSLNVNHGSVLAGNIYFSGNVDGRGSARFSSPTAIARDGNGNLYIADLTPQKQMLIRKITPDGYVSTLALNDQTGISSDITDNYGLHALAADSAGNIYFSSGSYALIKKADPQGNVTLLAGSTTKGFKDGKGQEAQFKQIIDMDVDHDKNVWVCDSHNNAIRKIAPDGTVITIAGNGTAGYVNGSGKNARFNYPFGITINKNGIAYVLEANNHTVRKIEYRQ